MQSVNENVISRVADGPTCHLLNLGRTRGQERGHHSSAAESKKAMGDPFQAPAPLGANLGLTAFGISNILPRLLLHLLEQLHT